MSDDSAPASNGSPREPEELAFDYIKANDFRVVWSDGAIGGITPTGLLHFALYSERPAIAQRQVFSISPSGLGDEIVEKRVSRNSIVREMACDVVMSDQAAENLANWLLERVSELRKMQIRNPEGKTQ